MANQFTIPDTANSVVDCAKLLEAGITMEDALRMPGLRSKLAAIDRMFQPKVAACL